MFKSKKNLLMFTFKQNKFKPRFNLKIKSALKKKCKVTILNVSELERLYLIKFYLSIKNLIYILKKKNINYFYFCDPEILILLPLIKFLFPNIKIIYDEHEVWPINFFNRKRNFLIIIMQILIYKFFYFISKSFIDLNLCASWQSLGKDKKLIKNKSILSPSKFKRKKFSNFKFVFLGTLNEFRGQKILQLLINFFQKIKINFLIDIYTDKFSKKNNLYLKQYKEIKFFNYTSIKKINLSKYNFGISFLNNDNFLKKNISSKIYDYYNANLNIIVTENVLLKKLFKHNNSVFMLNKNVDNLALLKNWLVIHKNKFKINSYTKIYSWNREEKKLIRLLNKI